MWAVQRLPLAPSQDQVNSHPYWKGAETVSRVGIDFLFMSIVRKEVITAKMLQYEQTTGEGRLGDDEREGATGLSEAGYY